jgi:MFS family permease
MPENPYSPPQSTDPSVPADRVSAMSLWHEPAFVRFWFASICTSFAFQMLSVAVALQIYHITKQESASVELGAAHLGLVGFVQFVPSVLLALVAGHVADQFERRRILQITLSVQWITVALLAFFTMTGQVNQIGILSAVFVISVAKTFEFPTMQSMLPSIVSRDILPRAFAMKASANQSAMIMGPAMGGFLYAAGAQVVYIIAAVLFFIASVLMMLMPRLQKEIRREPMSLATMFAGMKFIRERPVVLGVLSLDLFAVLLGGAVALLPIFADKILHVGEWGTGMLRASPAVGALLMSFWLARTNLKRRVGMVMFTTVAGFGVSMIVFGLSTNLWLSMVALFASGAFDMVSMVIRNALVQLDTPDAMRGRVSAVNSIFINTSNQLGEFESGMVAAWLGAVPATVIGGIGTLVVVGLWMWMFPTLRRRESLQTPIEEAQFVEEVAQANEEEIATKSDTI